VMGSEIGWSLRSFPLLACPWCCRGRTKCFVSKCLLYWALWSDWGPGEKGSWPADVKLGSCLSTRSVCPSPHPSLLSWIGSISHPSNSLPSLGKASGALGNKGFSLPSPGPGFRSHFSLFLWSQPLPVFWAHLSPTAVIHVLPHHLRHLCTLPCTNYLHNNFVKWLNF
jgi:hypothetical protein